MRVCTYSCKRCSSSMVEVVSCSCAKQRLHVGVRCVYPSCRERDEWALYLERGVRCVYPSCRERDEWALYLERGDRCVCVSRCHAV